MSLLKVGNLLFQLGDFAVKAIASFADTDEGEKEWGDVVSAFVELDLFNPADLHQGVSVTPTSEESEPLTDEEIERLLKTYSNPQEEKASAIPAASPRIVRRPGRPNVDDIPY